MASPGESDVTSLPADIPVEGPVEGPVKGVGGRSPGSDASHWCSDGASLEP